MILLALNEIYKCKMFAFHTDVCIFFLLVFENLYGYAKKKKIEEIQSLIFQIYKE